MKSLIRSLLLLVVLFSPAVAQQRAPEHKRRRQQERGIALVIGNGAYAFGRLRNPIYDARAMTKALRELDFDVTHREDLGLVEMKRALKEFGAKIKHGGVGLVYYAGHGVQVKGENYLIPVDVTPESAAEVEYEAVGAGLVLEQMASAPNGINILILDACRNNPFTRAFRSTPDGLAPITAPSGTIVAFATAPGSVASDGGSAGHGVYTEELLRYMREPGLSIEEVFKRVRGAVRNRTQGKQIPWEESSLIGDFYFTPLAAAGGDAAKAVEPDATVKPVPAKSLAAAAVQYTHGQVSNNLQLASYDDEPALVFSVQHIHHGTFRTTGCHGSLYVTQTRLVFEPVDSNHAFNQPRSNIKEAVAGHIAYGVFKDTLGPHIALKYGGETRRFFYYCQKKTGDGGACGFTIPIADYLFNLTATDFAAAVRKFQEYVSPKS
jgi:hypothetical protein